MKLVSASQRNSISKGDLLLMKSRRAAAAAEVANQMNWFKRGSSTAKLDSKTSKAGNALVGRGQKPFNNE